jgi:hypothetical protein
MKSQVEPQDYQLRKRIAGKPYKENINAMGEVTVPAYLKKSTISAGLKGPSAINFKLAGKIFRDYMKLIPGTFFEVTF